MTALRQATYSPACFNVGTIEQAKRIILTKEGDLTTDHRWATETPYLLSLIEQSMEINARSVVLDYGCGIGRMSKALIDRFGCRVIGADISPSMRALAASYVASDRFMACDPTALDWLGVKFDAALAVWVLQHCCFVEDDIARIRKNMSRCGEFFVVNDKRRIVPTREVAWINDGKDVLAMLDHAFHPECHGVLDPVHIGQDIADVSYWATFHATAN